MKANDFYCTLIVAEAFSRLPPEIQDLIENQKENKVASLLLLISHLHKGYKISFEEKGK